MTEDKKTTKTEKTTESSSSSKSGVTIAVIITVIITFLITAIPTAIGVYIWQRATCEIQKAELEDSVLDDVRDDAWDDDVGWDYSYDDTDSDDSVTSYDMDTEGTSPTDNTENFMMATLGTLPGASVDYDVARTYLSASQRARFSDSSFVPQFYGIQDGPDTYEMKTQTINGDTATVRVDVLYGEMMEAWAFSLIWEDLGWKIDGFRNDAQ